MRKKIFGGRPSDKKKGKYSEKKKRNPEKKMGTKEIQKKFLEITGFRFYGRQKNKSGKKITIQMRYKKHFRKLLG